MGFVGDSVKDLSPIMVAQDQDQVDKKRRYSLVKELSGFNVPAMSAMHIPVDLMWTVDGQTVMGEIKKTKDFMASYLDGRFYKQIVAMQSAGCIFYFVLIEHDMDEDENYVGGQHGWTYDQFDNAILDLEVYGGIKVVNSPSEHCTPRRIAAVWRYTGKDNNSAWQAPVPLEAHADLTRKDKPIIFFDETYRSHVGMVMHLPGAGLVTANDLNEQYTLMQILGITEEGLADAKARWLALRGIGEKKAKAWEEYLRA